MFQNTRSNRRHLAAAIAVNLTLAVVVSLGIVLRPLNVGMILPPLPAAGSRAIATAPHAGAATEQAAGAASVAGGSSPAARPTTVRGAAAPKATVPAGAAAAVLAATGPGVPAVAFTQGPVPRVEPTKAALRAAIADLDARTNLFRPTERQVREFADQACTAFDQGYSAAQVRSAVLDSAKKRAPFLRISSADAEYAVRSAVSLFCPGHQWLVA